MTQDTGWKLERAEQTAQEMGKGGRISAVEGWIKGGRVKASRATWDGNVMRYIFNDPVVHLSVGDVWFDDKHEVYPSERLVANLALALQAGVDRT